MDSVSLATGCWCSGPLIVADGFWARWRGLKALPRGSGLLLRASSVHGLGMEVEIWAAGIDRSRRVVGVKRLRPRGLVCFGRAHWVAELPIDREPPPVGALLVFRY